MKAELFTLIPLVIFLSIIIFSFILALNLLPPFLSLFVSCVVLLAIVLYPLVTNYSNYKEAKQLYSTGADIYVNGLPVYNLDFDGIDENTYTITISDSKDKIYLKTN